MAREHGARGARGPGLTSSLPAPDHHMQRATMIRGLAGSSSRPGTSQAVATGPRRQAEPPTTDPTLNDARAHDDAKRHCVQV